MEKILKVLVNKGNYLFVKTEEHSSVYVNNINIYRGHWRDSIDSGLYYAEVAEGPKGPYAECVGQYKAMLRRGYGDPAESAALIAAEKARDETRAKARAEECKIFAAKSEAEKAAKEAERIQRILDANCSYVSFWADCEGQGEDYFVSALRVDGKEITPEEKKQCEENKIPSYGISIPSYRIPWEDEELKKEDEYIEICKILKQKEQINE